MESRSYISTDARRQQYAIQRFLIGGMVLVLGTFLAAQLYHLISGNPLNTTAVWLLPAGVGMGGLYGLALRRHYRASAYLLIFGCLVVGIAALVLWSIDLPNGLLDFALIIVMSGRLVGTRPAAVVAIVVIIIMASAGLLQTAGVVDPDVSWLSDGVEAEDTLIFAAIFSAVAWVCWLTNRDTDRLLERAQESEAALRRERDSLEQVVGQRTSELKQLQLKQAGDVQRFAVIGRQTAGLLHDLVNPITAVTITLEQLNGEKHTQLIQQATAAINYLERYVTAARKQFQREGTRQQFNPYTEIQQVVGILNHQARQTAVELKLGNEKAVRLYGDPVRFSQMVLNLISNAIDAYHEVPLSSRREVHIQTTIHDDTLALTVTDYGNGIKSGDLPRIFEPFFSSKQTHGWGAGIGLAIARETVEQEFHGQISVTSQSGRGTTFRVELPLPGSAEDSTPRPV